VVDEIYVDDKIKDYVLSIVFATREPETYKLQIKDYIRYGASPRATIYLTLAAKALLSAGPRLCNAAGY